MTRLLLGLLLAAALSSPAAAQAVSQSSQATPATMEEVQAVIPRPADILPPSEALAPATGAQTMRYALEDHVHGRITRSGTAVTDNGGNWAITWATPTASIPTVYPVPVNTGSQPVVCNVSTRTTAGATGRCWMSRTLPAVLTLLTNLLNYDIFGATAPGITVQVLALPPSQ